MTKFIFSAAKIVVGSVLMLGAANAMANHVSVGINIGVPGVYVAPAPVYVEPQPVYVERVYERPVYQERVYVEPPPVYMVDHGRHRGWCHRHEEWREERRHEGWHGER